MLLASHRPCFNPTIACRKQRSAVAVQCSQQQQLAQQYVPDRRGLLLGLASLTAAQQLTTKPVMAEGALQGYTDAREKFTIQVPQGWSIGEGGLDGNSSFSGASGARRVVGWYDDKNPNNNAVVVITTIGPDYTSMGSFGTPYDFGSNMVGSMDRSYLLRAPEWVKRKEPLQIAKLVDSREISSAPKTYFVEYTIQRPNGENKHLYSVATLGFNGIYNRLYTITAQCDESAAGTMGKLLEQVVKSFAAPPLQDMARRT